jgi:hypothetical protein
MDFVRAVAPAASRAYVFCQPDVSSRREALNLPPSTIASRASWLLILGTMVVSLMLYSAAKYASPSLAEDVKMVIALLQLPVTAIIVAISVEDSAAMKAGIFVQDEK